MRLAIIVLALLVAGPWSLATAPTAAARTGMSVASWTSSAGVIALGAYRPEFPDDLGTVEAYERAAGKRMAIIHWYAGWEGWKSSFSRTDLELVDRRGSVPMVTWEPWDGVTNTEQWSLKAAILSGRHDAYIDTWARGLAAYGKPVLLRFAHEMHDRPQYPWSVGVHGNTAEDYVAAWRHVRAIFARRHAVNVQWVWNPNGLANVPAAAQEAIYRAVYPGDADVDWIGLGAFNTGPKLDWGAPYWRSFGEVLSESYSAITAVTDKPMLLTEVGSAEAGGDKRRWIAEALGPELPGRFPRVRAVIWFDVEKEERWQIASSVAARDAFISAWKLPHFATGGRPFLDTAGAEVATMTIAPEVTADEAAPPRELPPSGHGSRSP